MKTYYPNLNALRFIAATLVIIHHIELYKSFFNLKNFWNINFVQIVGKLGVVLFFVLSGFLITSLLLNEKDQNEKISFKKFYIRRILRIWPIYFLILILGFFVFPYFDFWQIPSEEFLNPLNNRSQNLLLYVFILPNLALAIFKNVPNTSQSWSIGTEEQFYLVWPLIINYFRKNLIPIMVFILFFIG